MSFSSSPSPYSISPEAFIALSQLNLQNPSQSQGQSVASYGLSQGQPAVPGGTQAALQQALQSALSGGSGLQGLVQGFLSNPSGAQSYAGSASQGYTPQQPANAWRLNFGGNNTPLFPAK